MSRSDSDSTVQNEAKATCVPSRHQHWSRKYLGTWDWGWGCGAPPSHVFILMGMVQLSPPSPDNGEQLEGDITK